MRNITLQAVLFALLVSSCNHFSPDEPVAQSIDHRSEYNDRIIVSTPESFELFNIAISLTDFGSGANSYVNKSSAYYQNIQSSFSNYNSHPFITLLEQFADQNFANAAEMDPNFNNIKEAGYYLNIENDSLSASKAVYSLLPDSLHFIVEQLVTTANSFRNQLQFSQFYNVNMPVYEDAADKFKMAIPAQAIRDWLESQFDISYDKYLILLSPLTGGSHCTFHDGLDKQRICMIVPAPEQLIYSKVDEGYYTLLLFTEIDHNYVNPTSDRYLSQINTAFADVDKWNNEISYRTPYDTFNEYMTWAAFTVFAHERYSASDFSEINKRTVDIMVINRKFIKFESFNNEILKLYENKGTGETFQDLYPKILQWALNQ